MRNGTPQIASLKRSLAFLEGVIADAGATPISALARSLGTPPSTAHRQVVSLVAAGYLAPAAGGRYVAGPRLLGMLHLLDEKQIIANIAAPILHRLAVQTRAIVQLGTLENDMVTYRIKTGRGSGDLFTKVGMQLEAYCSGIGKVLLAGLPRGDRDRYLAEGPFVPLTPRTITDPAQLDRELSRVRDAGYAVDNEEIVEGLRCIAVPVRRPDATVPAAISISRAGAAPSAMREEAMIELLRRAAAEITDIAFNGRAAVAFVS